ncbi:MAG: ribonuclease III [Acidimicrobiia bacterium]|nr:ribonuclease III [Acidimicrobiia bacterium]
MPAPPDPAPAALESLAERVGHRFAAPDLLALALTHRSWCAEHEGSESNERLEFLGDAVLGIVVTDHIYRTCPTLAEGAMAKVRAAVVSAPALAAVAAHLGMGEGLRLGKGEEATGGRAKPSILADALEAVLGAVYLDGGWPDAQRVVLALFDGLIIEAATDPGTQDYKTRLQELVARRFDRPPGYVVEEEGPDHDKLFRARVLVGGVELGVGEGRSKKQAQQAAAQVAWAVVAEGRDEAGEEASEADTLDPVQ